MTTLSNWGRWGKDDQLGALNLITAAKRQQAAALVRTGTVVSLSRDLPRDNPGAASPLTSPGLFAPQFIVLDNGLVREYQEIAHHGSRLSHMDALCHVSYDGNLYNGFNAKEVVTPDGGCDKLGIGIVKNGVMTRGVLLDMPGKRVRREDVEAWEKRTGVKISAGDALLLRSRREGVQPSFGSAGYDPSMLPFLKERDIALLGHDAVQEGGTVPGVLVPVHGFALVALGVHLLDNLDLETLAETAALLERWEFMLTVAPPRAQNGTGFAVNPIAVF
jgi:kynurenine formamidase